MASLSSLLRLFCLIFYHCSTSSRFSDLWKIATIIPIPKTAAASEPNDFRPLSVLPALSLRKNYV